MRCSLVSLTSVAILLVGSALAVEPGNNALQCDLSDPTEVALRNECKSVAFHEGMLNLIRLVVGQVTFDAMAAKNCSLLKCFGVIPKISCMFKCGLNPACILQCVPRDEVRLKLLGDVVLTFLIDLRLYRLPSRPPFQHSQGVGHVPPVFRLR